MISLMMSDIICMNPIKVVYLKESFWKVDYLLGCGCIAEGDN